MSEKFWGQHLLIDCAGCDKILIKSYTNIFAFAGVLTKKIGMVAYGEPIIKYFGEDNPKVTGYTLCQLIETSLIDAHFVDITGEAYISVHSCKNFDASIAEDVVKQFFAPEKIKSTVVYRGLWE